MRKLVKGCHVANRLKLSPQIMREWLKTSDVFIIARDRSGQPPDPICHTNAGLLIRLYVAGAGNYRDPEYST